MSDQAGVDSELEELGTSRSVQLLYVPGFLQYESDRCSERCRVGMIHVPRADKLMLNHGFATLPINSGHSVWMPPVDFFFNVTSHCSRSSCWVSTLVAAVRVPHTRHMILLS